MRRKIIRQGHNTYTVSLPKKWCDNHGLKEGHEIDIGEKGECLMLSKEAYRGTGEIAVDITGLDRSTIIILIESLYTYGYDKINITTKDSKVKYYMFDKELSVQSVVRNAIDLLIGAEIVSSSKNKYEIAVMTEDSREKFDMTLRRIFLLIIDLHDSFLEGITKKDKGLTEAVDLQHASIMKFINYALRLLNKFGYEDADKTTFYFSMINYLHRVERIPKNITGYVVENLKLGKKTCDIIEEIFREFKDYYEVFYKYDVKKISAINTKRDLLKVKIFHQEYKNLTKDEIFVLSSFSNILDEIVGLCEMRMAIEH